METGEKPWAGHTTHSILTPHPHPLPHPHPTLPAASQLSHSDTELNHLTLSSVSPVRLICFSQPHHVPCLSVIWVLRQMIITETQIAMTEII